MRRVNELQQELAAETQRQIEQMRQAEAQSRRERENLLRELQAANQELHEQFETLRRQEHERTQQGHNTAGQILAQAQEQSRSVETMPHTFFCPDQLAILREHLSAAERLMHNGMYEAAAAAAEAALAELELLEINIREREQEWQEAYGIYCRMIREIYSRMEAFEHEEMETPYGICRMDEWERNYWSCGSYGEVREIVLSALEPVRRIEDSGSAAAYLNTEEGRHSMNARQMMREISSLHRLSEKLSAAITCIRSERYFSDQRYQMGAAARGIFTDSGYRITHSRFRGEPDEEPIDCYDVEASINGLDTFRVSFVPQREHGVVIRNVCIVSVDIQTTPNSAQIRRMAETVIQRLRAGIPGLSAAWYPGNDVRIDSMERQYRQSPDMNRLAQRLERKYT